MKTSAALGAPLVGAALALFVVVPGNPADPPDADELARAVEEIEGLNALRSSLAGAFSGRPDRATFAEVCRPVGQRAKQLAEENGWKVQQLARKYRNPSHRLDPESERVYDLMMRDTELMGLWVRTQMGGEPGTRYFRRIVVEEACLACHGAKERRPEFIVQGYPEDRAYGFEVGDLRGLYSVFIADD